MSELLIRDSEMRAKAPVSTPLVTTDWNSNSDSRGV